MLAATSMGQNETAEAASAATPSGAPAAPPPVKRRRRILISSLILALVVASLFQIVARRDDWPLSNFRMYSSISGPTRSQDVLYGIDKKGNEFRLRDDMTRPISEVNMRHALDIGRSKAERKRLFAIERKIYEARRRAGKHEGPSLRGLRLYQEVVLLDKPPPNKTRKLLLELKYEPKKKKKRGKSRKAAPEPERDEAATLPPASVPED